MKNTTKIITKKRALKAGLLLLLIAMLFRPTIALEGAKSGLLLWFNTVLPTLLPFIIISSLIVKLQITRILSKILYPLLKHLLPISQNGSYPVFIGFLSGIPVGAKTVADLRSAHDISLPEGQYLLALCNNASPMFILGYICQTQLSLPNTGIILIGIIYLSAIISAGLLSIVNLKKSKKNSPSYSDEDAYRITSNTTLKKSTLHAAALPQSSPVTPDALTLPKKEPFRFAQFDEAILSGFEVVTKVGGYIILFSVLANLIGALPFLNRSYTALLTGILEITTGIHNIAVASFTIQKKIVLISTITAFGGLSGLAQTGSVLGDSGLSVKTYFLTKLVSAMCAFLLSSLYVGFLF
ncbi:MAG: hypothetical protein E7256_00100 [Lachnospiraceae bacterium]|nr:hypothetical protein [Lachnospiraceae bacterium]